jgi:hypothetical protein
VQKQRMGGQAADLVKLGHGTPGLKGCGGIVRSQDLRSSGSPTAGHLPRTK